MTARSERGGGRGDPSARRREAMIRRIVESTGLSDPRVVLALRAVPRHVFVDEALAARAYGGDPLPIGDGQTLSAPETHAAAVEALRLEGHERVLEVGAGSGYQTALLSWLAQEVWAVEVVASLGERARRALEQLGRSNVQLAVGDGSRGWPAAAPFDAIVLAAAAPRIPRIVAEQLRDGGRMVLPVAERGAQVLVRVVRQGDRFECERLGPCRFVPLVGAEGYAARPRRPEGAGLPRSFPSRKR